MTIFSKESLETLRKRIDLVDLLSSHVELKRAGAAYKGLCPFHDERTPSFTLQKGDSHYHCFGCGAHGDAIHFMMTHQKLSFSDAVESLAQRFHVHLERLEASDERKGLSKTILKEALEQACRLFHFILLHTPEGHQALHYLYGRGIDLEFIQQFRIGLAPTQTGVLRKVLNSKSITDEAMVEAGLLTASNNGGLRDFFLQRITFPICDPLGAIIGFSARKYKEETFGGKYVNSSETALFKKSRVLFGLNYSRRRIAKERKAIIVEGQIDALRLIQSGFNITVAGQGTAFGEGHVKELMVLGVNQVFLALDGDEAGWQASIKIGHFFQKEGVETRVLQMPQGSDPDTFLRAKGGEGFLKLMHDSIDYLTFLVRQRSRDLNLDSPAGKNELVQEISKQIRSWNHPLIVHESLRKLAQLTQVPEHIVGVGVDYTSNIYIKQSGSAGLQTIDPDQILESDFLRWLLLMGENDPRYIKAAHTYILPEQLHAPICRHLYVTYLSNHASQRPCDLLSLAIDAEEAETQALLSNILEKKVNKERAEQQFLETMQKISHRNWMESCEVLRMKIQSGQASDEEIMELTKQFSTLNRTPPKLKDFSL